jgi:hypothetical protein
VLPQLGWITIPLLLGWGDSYSSNYLANVEHVHPYQRERASITGLMVELRKSM